MSVDPKIIPPEMFEQIVRDQWIDCKVFHPGTSCEMEAIKRWFKVFRATYKYYIPIHLIPFLLFKLKQVRKEPKKTISRAFLQYIKSICFMASYIAILKYTLCAAKNIRHKVDEFNGTLGAFLAAWSVFFETESRRVEIALFIMTRFFETLWNYLKHRGYVKPIWSGENIVFGLAMGIIAYFYHCEETAIKHSYLSVFKKFWGKN